MGMAPTGKRVEMPAILIARISNGKLAQYWRQEDMLGLLRQSGDSGADGLTEGMKRRAWQPLPERETAEAGEIHSTRSGGAHDPQGERHSR
jgi:hypothetical protein